MSRREARRHTFVLIFQFPFHKPYDAETLAESKAEYLAQLPEGEGPDSADLSFIERTLTRVWSKCAELDDVIESCLKDWKIDRLNKIDLAILRLALYELLFEPDTPPGAVVNEAVEFAKRYGADESPAFVNGVLGAVSRLKQIGISKDE